jgi:hypothetical protein
MEQHQIEGNALRLIQERIAIMNNFDNQVGGIIALYVSEKGLPPEARLIPGTTVLTWNQSETDQPSSK